MSTALQRALAGEAVSDKAAPGALKEAAEKLNSLKERFATVKEHAADTAMAGVHMAESVTVAGAAGFAEGYWGPERMKVGGVPIRAATGVVIGGWGLVNMLGGKPGGHQCAIATGLIAAETTSMGIQAGRALREKGGKGGNAANAQPTPAQQAAIAANPGARLVDGKVVDTNGKEIAVSGTSSTAGSADVSELARLVRMQPGTEGDRELRPPPRRREHRDDLVRARAR